LAIFKCENEGGVVCPLSGLGRGQTWGFVWDGADRVGSCKFLRASRTGLLPSNCHFPARNEVAKHFSTTMWGAGERFEPQEVGPKYLPQFVPFPFGTVTGTLHQLLLADPCDTAATIHNSGSGVVLFSLSRGLGNGSVIPLTTQFM
jgi:hypothetical protein